MIKCTISERLIVPIDKSSVVLTILFAFLFLGEEISLPKASGGMSGLATGASWPCYYKALQNGPASVVVPVDKLSIVVTVAFSYLVFGERLSKKSVLGLGLIVAGTLVMLV